VLALVAACPVERPGGVFGMGTEQRFFGGLSLEETAEAVGVSLATVKRELRFARAWLAAELGQVS